MVELRIVERTVKEQELRYIMASFMLFCGSVNRTTGSIKNWGNPPFQHEEVRSAHLGIMSGRAIAHDHHVANPT
jgi:hypothetical protein